MARVGRDVGNAIQGQANPRHVRHTGSGSASLFRLTKRMTPNGQTGHPYPLFDLLGQPHENHRTTIDWYRAERLHRIRHEPFQPGCLIVAEDGAEGAPGFRVAEGGSDRTTLAITSATGTTRALRRMGSFATALSAKTAWCTTAGESRARQGSLASLLSSCGHSGCMGSAFGFANL